MKEVLGFACKLLGEATRAALGYLARTYGAADSAGGPAFHQHVWMYFLYETTAVEPSSRLAQVLNRKCYNKLHQTIGQI